VKVKAKIYNHDEYVHNISLSYQIQFVTSDYSIHYLTIFFYYFFIIND
jgi:hypothetical protein